MCWWWLRARLMMWLRRIPPCCVGCVLLADFRHRITKEGASFEEIASAESDCSSYKRGGDLGSFGRGKMQKECVDMFMRGFWRIHRHGSHCVVWAVCSRFEDAAFALAVGELSEPVSSESGIHLILRLE